MRELLLVLLLPALVGGLSTPALAEDALPPSVQENGLKVGSGRMHPFLEVESRYDSNAQLDPENASQIPDLVLHVKPGFSLSVPSRSLALDLGGFVDYNRYLGVENLNTTYLTRLLADAGINFVANQDGAVLARLGGHFTRTDNTPNPLLGQSAIMNSVQGTFGLGIQPGGKALVFDPGYEVDYDRYEPQRTVRSPLCASNDPRCNTDLANNFNNLRHTGSLNARWKFFPKTALVLDSSLTAAHYFQRPDFDTLNLKVQAGLQGLLTSRFNVIAKLGWGAQPGEVGAFSSVIAQLEGGYLVSEQTQFRLGYVRTFEPAPVPGGNYRDDRLYADGRVILGGRVLFGAGVEYDFLNYSGDVFGTGPGVRFRQLRLHAGLDFQVTDWFVPSVGGAFTQRTSENTSSPFPFDFQRTEGWVGVKFIY